MTLSDQKLFMKKAKEDILVMEKLCHDVEISDSSWGFHAQQALEKMIKSVLSKSGTKFAKSHDLNYLLELVTNSDSHFFSSVEDICSDLNPFAVTSRYDDYLDSPLD